ncbi:hypothetical protein HDA32_005529 [Spinactinospora alkalitolerans]|uniref:Uncharacterized protein n=1 Tax=Spinactinospora alkalitolerans TaxID=687207 RepID=A0A852U2I0_9ACTN|nr:hypothetical protein [Spinactinospora alkalitolerans]NYE50409.1 hypothetical protein [Spinactinospora alkalitolerans]
MMRLSRPVLAGIGAVAVAGAIGGAVLGTRASFTAEADSGALPVTAGELDVALRTGPAGAVRIDFGDAGPGRMWPESGAFELELSNTGDIDGVVSELATATVSDRTPEGAEPLSRALEVAWSDRSRQDWSDPGLEWEPVATAEQADGRTIGSDLGELEEGRTRTLYLKVRFAEDRDAADYAGSTSDFRLTATVRSRRS